MLVKFLSFAASLIGTGRYKPILLSGLVVLLSLSSVAALGSWKDDQGRLVASKLLLQEDKNTSSPQEFQGKQQATITQTTANSNETTKPTEATTSPSATTPTLDLNTQAITLIAGRTSEPLAASVKNGSWDFSITVEDSNISLRTVEVSPTSTKFTLAAAEATQPGTYRVAVQAKDKESGKTVLTKTILITVVAQ